VLHCSRQRRHKQGSDVVCWAAATCAGSGRGNHVLGAVVASVTWGRVASWYRRAVTGSSDRLNWSSLQHSTARHSMSVCLTPQRDNDEDGPQLPQQQPEVPWCSSPCCMHRSTPAHAISWVRTLPGRRHQPPLQRDARHGQQALMRHQAACVLLTSGTQSAPWTVRCRAGRRGGGPLPGRQSGQQSCRRSAPP
jgi:hypothetical protein